NQLSDLLDISF
ncbi:unnamed protein product, partial [Allacma fusca]